MGVALCGSQHSKTGGLLTASFFYLLFFRCVGLPEGLFRQPLFLLSGTGYLSNHHLDWVWALEP